MQFEEWLSDKVLDKRIFQIFVWQWFGLLCLGALSFIASSYIARGCLNLIFLILRRRFPKLDAKHFKGSIAPFRLLIATAIFYLGSHYFDLATKPHMVFATGTQVVAVIAFTWLIFRQVDAVMGYLTDYLTDRHDATYSVAVPLIRRITKVFFAAIAILFLFQSLGVNVTAIIAGLGVGGLGIALASQKTIENLFGGVMLILDQPVRVGDSCRFGTQMGEVEDIGLRSTRVRTLERSVICIPNSEFSNMQLENYAQRDRYRLNCVLPIKHDTSPDQLRYLLVEIRRLLYAHPKIDRDPARVRLIALGASSLDIEINAYALTTEKEEFLAIREDIFLRILEVVSQSGSALAIPVVASINQIALPPNAERTHRAENTVAQWRTNGQLPLPDFPEAMIDSIDDSLDYPPKGSVLTQR